MIKLIDSTRDIGNGSVLTLFADSKDEVETAWGEEPIVGFKGFNVPFGSKLITGDGATAYMKSDGYWAWQGSTPTPDFYFILQDYDMEDHTYYCDEEMTWGDFIDSDYNTDAAFGFTEDYIQYWGNNITDGDGQYQTPAGIIQVGETYYLE